MKNSVPPKGLIDMPGLMIINALFFLLSIPGEISLYYSFVMHTGILVMGCWIFCRLYQADLYIIALFFLVVGILYNPLVFLSPRHQSWVFMNIALAIALTMFLIAMLWNRIIY